MVNHMDIADESGFPTTVCASPMGRRLYEHLKLGFEVIGTELVKCDGEEEVLETTVMVRRYTGRGSKDEGQGA